MLNAFFNWQIASRYLAANPISSLADRIRTPKRVEREILALGLREAEALLRGCLNPVHRSLIGFIAIAMFEGVRPAEIERTDLSCLSIEGGTLRVTAKAAKTAKNRVIELEPVTIAWLKAWREWCPNQATICPIGQRRRMDKLRADAGMLEGWEHDVLRHTAASMHYSARQNATALKSKLGHTESEDTLFQHYRATVTVSGETITRAMAEAFYGLTPEVVGAHSEAG